VRVGRYGGTAGALVRQWKFGERADIEPILCDWLADGVAAATWADRIEAVTFVPTHWRRMIRGRPQLARALARGVARRIDRPCVNLLRRTRSGPRQVGLSYAQRWENVRGAFALRPGTRLAAARVLIVDDVRTTGATLEECARAIRRGDRQCEVYAAVAARARGAEDDLDAI
jgi:predicted amidophosphoribosyltransferase